MCELLDEAVTPYDCVIFDLDGTLLRLHVDWSGLKKELESTFSVPFERLGAGLRSIENTHGAEGLESARDIVRRYEAEGAAHSILIDSTLSLAYHCLGRGQRLGIFTANLHATAQHALEMHGIANMFMTVVAGDDVDKPKPDPEGLLLVLDRLGGQPHRAVYVADGPSEVDTGSAVGVKTFTVN